MPRTYEEAIKQAIDGVLGRSAERRRQQRLPSRRSTREVKARTNPTHKGNTTMSSSTMIEPAEPSVAIKSVLSTVATRSYASKGMRAIMERQSEFPGPVTAKLTGIALDPNGRELADQALDKFWSAYERNRPLESFRDRELIIGSGYHAAVYSAIRVLSGYPKPIVLERNGRVGGTFAVTSHPTFYLNSRNRAGMGGLAGDLGASPNFLPGGLIQAANVSMNEYQTNAEMAFVIRLALAQYADVITNAEVNEVAFGDNQSTIAYLQDGRSFYVGRIIDARGLGDPIGQSVANGTTILTFPQFMQRMGGMWPLRDLNRVAVVGGGDSGKVSVEALLGIGPQPNMSAMALDKVEQIDWYATNLPINCRDWKEEIRGRYAAIGRYLRADSRGARRLFVLNQRAVPIPLPQGVLINGRTYDLVVLATGNKEQSILGIDAEDFDRWPNNPDADPYARKHSGLRVWRVGPHADLPFTTQERYEGIADNSDNRVSMFRTGSKTATLAATLRELPSTPSTESFSPYRKAFNYNYNTVTDTTSGRYDLEQ